MKADVTLEHPRLGLRLEGAEYHIEVLERYEAYHGGSGPAGRRFVGERPRGVSETIKHAARAATRFCRMAEGRGGEHSG